MTMIMADYQAIYTAQEWQEHLTKLFNTSPIILHKVKTEKANDNYLFIEKKETLHYHTKDEKKELTEHLLNIIKDKYDVYTFKNHEGNVNELFINKKDKKENIKIINNSGYWLQYKDYVFDYQLSKAQAQEIKKQID